MTTFVWIPAACFGSEWNTAPGGGRGGGRWGSACGMKSGDTGGICTEKREWRLNPWTYRSFSDIVLTSPPPPPWPHGSIDITRHKRKSTLSHTAAWISDVTQNYLVPYRNDNVLTKVKFEVQWNFIECVRFLETCILIQQTLRRSSQSSGLLLCSHFSHKESTDGDVFIPSEQQENTIWKRVTSLISESDSE